MADHPSEFELDAFQFGEANAETELHVGDCAQCQAHLHELSHERIRFLEDESSENFLGRPAIAAELNRPSSSPEKKSRPGWVTTWLAPLLVGAMAVVLVVNGDALTEQDQAVDTAPTMNAASPAPASTAKKEALRTSTAVPLRKAMSRPSQPAKTPDRVATKGGDRVMLVVIRNGKQLVLNSPVALQLGDRFRVIAEFTRSRHADIAILEKDGTLMWLSSASAAHEAGRHPFPKEAIGVKEDTAGWVLVGSRKAIETAVANRHFKDLIRCQFATPASSSR